MAQSQAAMNQPVRGDFAAMAMAMGSPGSTPMIADKPNANSPQAKRPRDLDQFARASNAPGKLSMDELTTGFHGLSQLQVRDEGFASEIGKVTTWNAQLLNDLIVRVNAIEASTSLIGNEQQKQQMVTESLKIVVEQSLAHISEQDVSRDKQLRKELDEMTVKLETGHSKLL